MTIESPKFCACGVPIVQRKQTCARCLAAHRINRRTRERDRIRTKRKDPAYREREKLATRARMRRLRANRREAMQYAGQAHV
jgi:hypothetical protein